MRGWCLFFAAMLLVGIFAVLKAEGKTAPESASDVVLMQDATLPAIVAENIQADTPAYFESYAESGDYAAVGHATVEKASDSLDLYLTRANAANFHRSDNTYNANLGTAKIGAAYNLLCFWLRPRATDGRREGQRIPSLGFCCSTHLLS